jgi:hypothetical protein
MVALPPLAAPSIPSVARPAQVVQPSAGSTQETVRQTQQAQAAAEASANRQAQQQEQLRAAADRAQDQLDLNDQRPKPQVPEPAFAQNVGLFNNSFRVFVDIVLSSDTGRRVARVYGTPPAEKLDIPGPGPNRVPSRPINIYV